MTTDKKCSCRWWIAHVVVAQIFIFTIGEHWGAAAIPAWKFAVCSACLLYCGAAFGYLFAKD